MSERILPDRWHGTRGRSPRAGAADPRTPAAWPASMPSPASVAAQFSGNLRERASSGLLGRVEFAPGQAEAVTHGEGPVRIIAPPGTGKTLTLAWRMAHLVAQGSARPHEILAVTFTRKAADELRGRLVEVTGIGAAAGLKVWTIHKLCRDIVRAHAFDLGRGKGFEILNRAGSMRLVASIIGGDAGEEVRTELQRGGLAAGDELVRELVDEISLAKNALQSIDEYRELSPHQGRALVAAVWREHDRRLQAANAFDLDDLIRYAVALLRYDAPVQEDGAGASGAVHRARAGQAERLRAHYGELYWWLLIDEFQDVNVAQMELVRLLKAPHGNLTVAGDEDQCLYGFRLASPENILNFTEDFPSATTIKLSVNRRSRPKILRAALAVISHNEARVPKPLVPVLPEGGFVGARGYATDEDEAADITRLVRAELALGREPRELLVLCSQNRPLERLQRRLEDQGIRVRLLGGRSLWERAEIRDAIAYVQLLANPFDADAFRRALAAPSDRRPFIEGKVSPPQRCSSFDDERVMAFAEHHQLDLITATLRIEEIDGVRPSAREPMREFAIELDRVRRKGWPGGAVCAGVSDLLSAALSVHGGPLATYEHLQDHAVSPRVRDDARRVLEDLLSLRRAAERYEEAPGVLPATLSGFVESLQEPDEHELTYGQDDRVTLATGHAGKGGEAETVIVIGAEEGLLPDRRAPLEEQRRLFYVAATRAKENLLFTWVATRDGRRSYGPSRFLAEAGLI